MKNKVDLHCPADTASEIADRLDEFANRVRKGEIRIVASSDRSELRIGFERYVRNYLEIEYIEMQDE